MSQVNIDRDKVTVKQGELTVTHTKDTLTINVATDVAAGLINCDPKFGQDIRLINCDPKFGVFAGIDQSNTTDLTVPVGEFSDGYHTFNELYEHRTALFATICNLLPERSWKSFKHADGSMFDGMFIAGILTPQGQYTYHCEEKYLYMFAKTPEIDQAPEWDGHRPEDFTRLLSINLEHCLGQDETARCQCKVDLGKLAWNEEEEQEQEQEKEEEQQ